MEDKETTKEYREQVVREARKACAYEIIKKIREPTIDLTVFLEIKTATDCYVNGSSNATILFAGVSLEEELARLYEDDETNRLCKEIEETRGSLTKEEIIALHEKIKALMSKLRFHHLMDWCKRRDIFLSDEERKVCAVIGARNYHAHAHRLASYNTLGRIDNKELDAVLPSPEDVAKEMCIAFGITEASCTDKEKKINRACYLDSDECALKCLDFAVSFIARTSKRYPLRWLGRSL